MKNNNTVYNVSDLETIVDTLLMEGSLVECNGLIHGKMGIAVFFFHYARHTGDELYEEYALELIESVMNDISLKTPVHYWRGLAGIGCAIEYLSQQKFLEIDSDDVLEDFDRCIFDAIMCYHDTDVSLFDGLSGLGRYCLRRIINRLRNEKKNSILTAKKMIEQSVDMMGYLLDKKQNDSSVEDAFHFFEEVNKLNLFPVKSKHIMDKYSHLHKSDLRKCEQTMYVKNKRLGLYHGYAGVAMNILSQLNQNHQTWVQLL
jgi:lantibiotic modifying enzyme